MNELFNFLKPLSDRTTPRWIILVIDMLIVVLSCALVSASDTFNVATISRFDILRNYCVVVGVFVFVSFFSKSYAYIIRLTALNDLPGRQAVIIHDIKKFHCKLLFGGQAFLRESSTTISTCSVKGNISTGHSLFTAYPCPVR